MKNLTVNGHEERLKLKPITFGMFEVWCQVWVDGKRDKSRDGYFLKSHLKIIK